MCSALRFERQLRRERATVLFALALLAATVYAQAPEPPPLEDATTQQVLEHVLAQALGSWQRAADLRLFGPERLAGAMPDEAEMIRDYELELGACAVYVDAETGAQGEALILAFPDALGALGVFARHRGQTTQRAATVRAGYLDGATLHLYTGRFYLRVTPAADGDEGRSHAHALAGELEARVPPPARPPRLMRTLPRRWLNPFRMDYARTDLLGPSGRSPRAGSPPAGEGERPMTLTGEYELGETLVRVAVLQARDPDQARGYYLRLAAHLAEQTKASPLPALGEEAFVVEHADHGLCAGMLQDEFVAVVLGAASAEDAEALLRLGGVKIRITRPLPSVSSP